MLAKLRQRIDPALLGILALALLWRLLLWAWLPHRTFISDENEYWLAAWVWAQGRGFSFHQTFIWTRPPGYILFLGLLIRLFGPHLTVARLAQAGVSLLTILLLYDLALRLFGDRRAARGSALAAALFYPYAAYPHILLTETLTLPLILAVFAALARWARRRERRWLLAAGLLLGVGALVKALVLTFVPFVALWVWAQERRRGWGAAAAAALLLALVSLLPVLPWSLYASRLYGGPVLLDTTGGHNFYLGTQAGRGGEKIYQELREIPNPAQRQREGYRRGLAAVAADPIGFLAKGVREALDLWQINYGAAERLVRGFTYGQVPIPHLLSLLLAEDTLYLLLLLAGAVGLALAPPHPLRSLLLLWVAHGTLMAGLFFAINRFRIPLLPVFFLYGGWVLARRPSLKLLPGRTKGRLALGLLAILVLLLPSYVDSAYYTGLGIRARLRARHRQLGERLLREGRPAEALAAFRRDNLQIPLPHIGIAYARERLGDREGAVAELEPWTWHPLAAAALGDLYRRWGELDRARTYLDAREVKVANPQDWAWAHLWPPPTDRIDVGSGLDLGYLRGTHIAEAEGETTYRWTQEEAQVRFPAPLPHPPEGVRLRLRAWRPAGMAAPTLTVLYRGRTLGRWTVPADWTELTVPLPDGIPADEPLVLTLRVDGVLIPGGFDPRVLGVQVDWVALK